VNLDIAMIAEQDEAASLSPSASDLHKNRSRFKIHERCGHRIGQQRDLWVIAPAFW
jgi:hypothetical protein